MLLGCQYHESPGPTFGHLSGPLENVVCPQQNV